MNWQREGKYLQKLGEYSVCACGHGKLNGETQWKFAAFYKDHCLAVLKTSEQARAHCVAHKNNSVVGATPADGG